MSMVIILMGHRFIANSGAPIHNAGFMESVSRTILNKYRLYKEKGCDAKKITCHASGIMGIMI